MVAMRPPISGDSFFDINTEERFDIWVSGKLSFTTIHKERTFLIQTQQRTLTNTSVAIKTFTTTIQAWIAITTWAVHLSRAILA